MNSAEEIYARLNLPPPDEATVASWAETMRDVAGAPPFFADAFVLECCTTLGIKADVADALRAAAAACDRNDDIRLLGWHWHRRLGDAAAHPHFPRMVNHKEEWAKLFFALIFLSRTHAILNFHRSRRIVHAISVDTLSDLELWIRECRRLSGEWGLHRPEWLLNHFTGKIYKLGRLQFESHESHSDVIAYRHNASRKVLLFAASGEFRADGQYATADGGREPAAFSAEFSDDGARLRGHPISPRGFVEREPVELKAAEWTRIFGRGDPVLGIHIAATGPMDHAACGLSMDLAVPFYTTHFPDRPFKALSCGSWLLDPQFEKYLPAEANIVRFLSEFYLHPHSHANDEQTYERVFDNHKMDVNVAPQRSSLQRAIVDHVKAGGRWRSGSALYFPEDLNWGGQVYRAMWPHDESLGR